MIYLLGYAIGAPIAVFILWVMFVIVMTMAQLRDAGRLSPLMINVGLTIAYVGLVWDVLCNIFIASVVFLEVPFEATVSARMRRLVTTVGWRADLAIWFAEVTMNPFCPIDNPHILIPKK
jgi:hypothetical protein